MNHKEFANQIIAMRDLDLAFRDKLIQNGELADGYNPEMERIHNENAKKLNEIIDKIGYPTIGKVGKEASEAAWLVIQHAIAKPDFMRNCATLLEKEVKEKKADPKQLAYLTDRIAVFEGRPQLYGTNFDWDENGKLNPNKYDDLAEVNRRRKFIGLNTLEEQTGIIKKQALAENEFPPTELQARKKLFDDWRKNVGWIK